MAGRVKPGIGRTRQRARQARAWDQQRGLEAEARELEGPRPMVSSPDEGSIEDEYLRRSQEDPRWFIERHLHCRHIDGGRLVPMKLKLGQRRVMDAIERQKRRGDPVRVVALKNRKHGMSTFGLAYAYSYASTRAYVQALVMAHKIDLTEEFLQAVKDFYYTDERRELGIWPASEKSNRKELVFGNPDPKTRGEDPGLRSTIRITSADAFEPGMGSTIHFLLCSEAARWQNPGATRAAFNAMSKDKDSVIIMESTAFGIGGMFHETYMAARAGKGSGYEAVFLSWVEDERLRLELSPEERRTWDWLSQEERDYAERWGLSLEQAKWRRQTLQGPECFVPGQTPEQVFDQEYPASEELAFVGTGRNFFLIPALVAHRKSDRGAREPRARYEIDSKLPLEQRGFHNPFKVEVVLHEQSYGPLHVWELPKEKREYIVGGDCAKGVSQGDNHVAAVLDRVSLEFVCTWKGNHVSTRRFGQIASLMAWWYNTATLAIENNHFGLAAVEEARRILYPRQWYHVDVRRIDEEPEDRLGWNTTEASRSQMLGYMEHELRGGLLGIYDDEFFEEALTFVKNDSGKPVAMVGKHDDHVIAFAIALAVHVQSGPVRGEKPAAPAMGKLVPDFGHGRIDPLPGRMRRVKRGDIFGGRRPWRFS